MPRNRKRKHEDSDAITVIDPSRKEHKKFKTKKAHHNKTPNPPQETPRLTPPTSTISSEHDAISQSFATFKRALCSLLSTCAVPDLRAFLGDEPANFVDALQTMKSSGDLTWLDNCSLSDTGSLEEGEEPENGLPTPKHSPEKVLLAVPPLSLSTAAVVQTWPPPLPTVKNEALRQQAFTHRSFIKGEEVGLPGTEQRHYERLEFLGDSYLQSIASHLLYTRFHTQREGTLSDMRQQLVANKPLSTYATMYKFHTMVREGKGQENLTPVQQRGGNRGKVEPGKGKADLNKTLADCFEAYIAAIILDDPVHGIATVTEWLKALYEPKMKEMEIQHENIAPIDKMAKQTLNTIAGGNKVNIEYKWTDGNGGNKGGFWMTVLLTGWGWKEREIGRGWGSNKGDAALRAAMNVIGNKEFVEEMAATRLKWLGPKPGAVIIEAPLPMARPVAHNGDVLNYDD